VDLLPGFGVTADFADLRILENRAVEICGFLGLRVEPQTRGDIAYSFILFPFVRLPTTR
jgi:hypothetical protein